jgi:hypothetical protein
VIQRNANASAHLAQQRHLPSEVSGDLGAVTWEKRSSLGCRVFKNKQKYTTVITSQPWMILDY